MENDSNNKECIKYLCIFHNYKETIDNLPKKHRGTAWRIIIDYAFEGETAVKNDLNESNKHIKMAFSSIKNLLKLNKKAGSQGGISNNPSGLSKKEQANIGPNIGANLGPIPYIKEKNINENNIKGIEGIREREYKGERDYSQTFEKTHQDICQQIGSCIKRIPSAPYDSQE